MALQAAGQLPEALTGFQRARSGAERSRLALLEAYAAWGERSCAYRLRTPPPLDPELCEAIALLGAPRLRADNLLNEAAIAWRAGAPEASALAGEALALWASRGSPRGALLAHALLVGLGEAAPEAEPRSPEALVTAAMELGPPALVLQVAALLALGGAAPSAAALGWLREHAPPAAGWREAVLDSQEAWRYLSARTGES
jgi:hypothetical protein